MDIIPKEFNIQTGNTKFPAMPLSLTSLIPNQGQATSREIHRYQKCVGKLN